MAALVAMGCVKADRVRAWRESVNPSDPDIPDSAFVVARVTLFAVAAVGLYFGFQSLAVADDAEWSDDELSSAVRGATAVLDGSTTFGDLFGAASDFDGEIARKIEDEVVEHGGCDAPQTGVDASRTGPATSEEASYVISAGGAKAAFCMHVGLKHRSDTETASPGIPGDAGKATIPVYTFTVSSRKGEY